MQGVSLYFSAREEAGRGTMTISPESSDLRFLPDSSQLRVASLKALITAVLNEIMVAVVVVVVVSLAVEV